MASQDTDQHHLKDEEHHAQHEEHLISHEANHQEHEEHAREEDETPCPKPKSEMTCLVSLDYLLWPNDYASDRDYK